MFIEKLKGDSKICYSTIKEYYLRCLNEFYFIKDKYILTVYSALNIKLYQLIQFNLSIQTIDL